MTECVLQDEGGNNMLLFNIQPQYDKTVEVCNFKQLHSS